jgi:hypothetical protein
MADSVSAQVFYIRPEEQAVAKVAGIPTYDGLRFSADLYR